MPSRLLRHCLLVAALACLAAWPVRAELSVSVTLTGDLDEIIAVLQQLRAHSAAVRPDEDANPLRIQIQSILSGVAPDAAAPDAALEDTAAEETQPAPPPALRLEEIRSEPETLIPGTAALLTVRVVDEAGVIDTLSARMSGTNAILDLYDNATHGDRVAGDGLWSAAFTVPEDLRPGSQSVSVVAYDATGAPVTVLAENGREMALAKRATLRIGALPEAAEEAAAEAASP